MNIENLVKGIVYRVLPGFRGDTTEGALRLGRYGEAMVAPIVLTKHPLADEGSYFTTQNPTLGTALQYAVTTSFTDTVGAFVFQNTADPSQPNSPFLYLDFIKLAFTVAPASATGMRYAVKLDSGNRAPTAGSTQLTGQGGSPGASPTGPIVRQSVSKIWSFTGGASLTVPASVNARVVALGGIGALPVVGSEFMLRFGDTGPNSGGAASGTSHAAPVVIAPGWFAVVYLWFPSNATTPASVELDIGWYER
jgi:hypothetical protein